MDDYFEVHMHIGKQKIRTVSGVLENFFRIYKQ